ncbi:hypothetical protein G6F31_013596 [Rhizopus arrhizus]|nr:hypothetical protein G6F31_013596 [Rhizopus arrhizus]
MRVQAEGVVDRQRLHLRHHGFRIRRAGGLHRLQVMPHRAIHARLQEGGRAADARFELLGEGARAVVHVPIRRHRQIGFLRRWQAQAVHVRDQQQHGGQLLRAADAEVRGLLDGRDGVAARVRDGDDLRLGALRL